MSNIDKKKAKNPILAIRTELEVENIIKKLREKLGSFETPDQREQYIRGLIHGHLFILETIQSGLKRDLNEINLNTFLKSEIQFQKIFWRSVRDRI